ncbi:MAG TPA: MraY family glycosyltransferase [Puia sp.]|nr:MraY family glycosyltransferase [Puia sp.]
MSNSILFIFPVTFALVWYMIRKIIYISEKKHLFDEPVGNRKIHLASTPNLGGVAIFATMLFVSFLFFPAMHVEGLRYICACAVLLFFLGLTDDIVGVNPAKKLVAQVIVALLITIPANMRITGFHGFLGWQEMSYPVSIIFSVLFILLVINAFNLIDGIDCLAGGIGLLTCCVFACYFWRMHEEGYFFLSVAMCGCLTGFLIFNRTPARIFMGDTGSLFLGFMASVLAIRFIGSGAVVPGAAASGGSAGGSAIAIVAALLIIPVYDTMRVFFVRLRRGKSPFAADKRHIHHLLLDLRLSHLQATSVLLVVNILALVLAFATRDLAPEFQLLILAFFMLLMNGILLTVLSRQRNNGLKTKSRYVVMENVAEKGAIGQILNY